MYKSLFLLAALALLTAACNDKMANTNDTLSFTPSTTNPVVAVVNSETATEDVTITPPVGTEQPIKTLAQMIAEDPHFHPDTSYAVDFISPDGTCAGPGCSHETKRDYITGEVISDITYDFSSLLENGGDHVVLFEGNGVAVWIDYND